MCWSRISDGTDKHKPGFSGRNTRSKSNYADEKVTFSTILVWKNPESLGNTAFPGLFCVSGKLS